MIYLWIFLGCYALAFVIITMKMAAQTARMKSRLRDFGASEKKFDTIYRHEISLLHEILIRIWSPFIFSVIPAVFENNRGQQLS